MDKMQYILAAIGLFFTVCIGIAKFNRDGWKNRYQTYLDFAVAFDKDKPNKFLVEQLFSSITKCRNAAYHEICYLMISSNPTQTTSDFCRIIKHGKIITISESGFAMYSDNCNSPKKRRLKIIRNIVMFIFVYGAAIVMPSFIGRIADQWVLTNIDIENYILATTIVTIFVIIISLFLVLFCMRLVISTLAILKSNRFIDKFNLM
ncbi:hypothetical protein ACX1H4_10505 [Yersinia enterocolitica]|uniref:hypothetical protein n=1 Tax=Yersinia enterocolitica TaxID=630 RepID=UPI0005DD0933|nr:hypothetical protein [Yersinia enterocolitica]EKN3573949.1 hypothetical protein [Yersinia enterocolitica]EKN4055068.1 hypothetical protein [Yersinia enterocolitica]EKN4914340.1 hypothetical protein [Yersinia enterocolitica]UYK06114.1 hypothetical protein N4218_21775 [Yersinia enterocolitica]CQJ13607.1 Uncharacterised protein [Yersinia enterocolitica]